MSSLSNNPSSIMIPWTRNRLPQDLVKGRWQEREEYALAKPTTVAAMRLRLFRVLQLRNGYLNTRNFIYGREPDKTYKLLDQALPHVAPIIRKVKLDMYQLDHGGGPPRGMAKMLATSRLLSCIELDGRDSETPHLAPNLAVLLQGLAQNPSQRLTSMKFIETYLRYQGSEETRTKTAMALAQLNSLKTLEFHFCSMDMVTLICRGLQGHPGLTSVKIASRYDAEDVVTFLLSLPNLQSLELNCISGFMSEALPDIVTNLQRLSLPWLESEDDYACVTRALQGASHLRTLQVEGYLEHDIRADALGAVLPELPELESLKIAGLRNVQWITKCTGLKQLEYYGLNRQQKALIRTLLDHKRVLETMIFPVMTNDEMLTMLQGLESNSNVSSIRANPHEQQTTIFTQLRRTLTISTTLKKLHMRFNAQVVPILVELMGNNACSLEYLCLDDIDLDSSNMAHVVVLLRSLIHNTTLSGLTLCFEYPDSFVTRQVWRSVLEMICHNARLNELVLSFRYPEDRTPPINVDDFARALNKKSNLTNIRLTVQYPNNGHTQPHFDFVCRLYARRNRIRQMVKAKNVPDALWPRVLESLVPDPSSLYLTMRYIPWPTPATDVTA